MANIVAASLEYSRSTCSASMQHVSEQKENKISWLDQLGSWWDKNSTAITTGVMAIAIGTVAVLTVVATGGLAAPALGAVFAGALGTTYGALAGSLVVSGIAAAGVTAATTGVVSLASTVPGLNQALSPTVNSTSFQMLQSGSMIIAGTGAAFLAQFAPTSNNKTQTQKEEAQAEAKVGEQTSTAGNTAGENAGQVQRTEESLDEAAVARKWQGSGAYPGVDDWGNTELKKGAKVWGGAPGQSNFYTTEETMQAVGNDATKLNQGLQISKGIYPEFRPGMTQYEVMQDINVGYSKALANPQYGAGGFDEYFISNYENVLKPIKSIIMTNR